MSSTVYTKEPSDILDERVDSSSLLVQRLGSWQHATAVVLDFAKHRYATQHATTQQLAKQRKIAGNLPSFSGSSVQGGSRSVSGTQAPEAQSTAAYGSSTGGSDSQAGISHAFVSLAQNTESLFQESESNEQSIKQGVIPNLELLLSDLDKHIKTLSSQGHKGQKEVEKQREATIKQLEAYERSLTTAAQATRSDPKSDPYTLHRKVRSVAAEQIQRENSLAESNLNIQHNYRSLEQHIIEVLQNAVSSLDELSQRFHKAGIQASSNTEHAFRAVSPENEWSHFYSTNKSLLVPEEGYQRDPTKVFFANSGHEATVPLMEGSLSRKGTVLKGNKPGYYVLTPSGYLHQFKSSDYVEDPTPEISLYIPESELGGLPARNSGDLTFKIASRDSKKAFSTRHRYTFTASSYDELQAWFNALSRVAGSTGSSNIDGLEEDDDSATPASPTGAAAGYGTPSASIPQGNATPDTSDTLHGVPAAGAGAAGAGAAGAVPTSAQSAPGTNAYPAERDVQQQGSGLVGASPEYYQKQAASPDNYAGSSHAYSALARDDNNYGSHAADGRLDQDYSKPSGSGAGLGAAGTAGLGAAGAGAGGLGAAGAGAGGLGSGLQDKASSAGNYGNYGSDLQDKAGSAGNYGNYGSDLKDKAGSAGNFGSDLQDKTGSAGNFGGDLQSKAGNYGSGLEDKAGLGGAGAGLGGAGVGAAGLGASGLGGNKEHFGNDLKDKVGSNTGNYGSDLKDKVGSTGNYGSDLQNKVGGSTGHYGDDLKSKVGGSTGNYGNDLKDKVGGSTGNYGDELKSKVGGSTGNYGSDLKDKAGLGGAGAGGAGLGAAGLGAAGLGGNKEHFGSDLKDKVGSNTGNFGGDLKDKVGSNTGNFGGDLKDKAGSNTGNFGSDLKDKFGSNTGNYGNDLKDKVGSTGNYGSDLKDKVGSTGNYGSDLKDKVGSTGNYGSDFKDKAGLGGAGAGGAGLGAAGLGAAGLGSKSSGNGLENQAGNYGKDFESKAGLNSKDKETSSELRDLNKEFSSNYDKDLENAGLSKSGFSSAEPGQSDGLSQFGSSIDGYKSKPSPQTVTSQISGLGVNEHPYEGNSYDKNTTAGVNRDIGVLGASGAGAGAAGAYGASGSTHGASGTGTYGASAPSQYGSNQYSTYETPASGASKDAYGGHNAGSHVYSAGSTAGSTSGSAAGVQTGDRSSRVPHYQISPSKVNTLHSDNVDGLGEAKSFGGVPVDKPATKEAHQNIDREADVGVIDEQGRYVGNKNANLHHHGHRHDPSQGLQGAHAQQPDIGRSNPGISQPVDVRGFDNTTTSHSSRAPRSSAAPTHPAVVTSGIKDGKSEPKYDQYESYSEAKSVPQAHAPSHPAVATSGIKDGKPEPKTAQYEPKHEQYEPQVRSEPKYESKPLVDEIKPKDVEYSKPDAEEVPQIAAGKRNPLLGSTTEYGNKSVADKIEPKDAQYSTPNAGDVPNVAASQRNPLLGSTTEYGNNKSAADKIQPKDAQYSTPNAGDVPNVAASQRNPLLGSTTEYGTSHPKHDAVNTSRSKESSEYVPVAEATTTVYAPADAVHEKASSKSPSHGNVGISDLGSTHAKKGHGHTHSFEQVERDTSSPLDPLSKKYGSGSPSQQKSDDFDPSSAVHQFAKPEHGHHGHHGHHHENHGASNYGSTLDPKASNNLQDRGASAYSGANYGANLKPTTEHGTSNYGSTLDPKHGHEHGSEAKHLGQDAKSAGVEHPHRDHRQPGSPTNYGYTSKPVENELNTSAGRYPGYPGSIGAGPGSIHAGHGAHVPDSHSAVASHGIDHSAKEFSDASEFNPTSANASYGNASHGGSGAAHGGSGAALGTGAAAAGSGALGSHGANNKASEFSDASDFKSGSGNAAFDKATHGASDKATHGVNNKASEFSDASDFKSGSGNAYDKATHGASDKATHGVNNTHGANNKASEFSDAAEHKSAPGNASYGNAPHSGSAAAGAGAAGAGAAGSDAAGSGAAGAGKLTHGGGKYSTKDYSAHRPDADAGKAKAHSGSGSGGATSGTAKKGGALAGTLGAAGGLASMAGIPGADVVQNVGSTAGGLSSGGIKGAIQSKIPGMGEASQLKQAAHGDVGGMASQGVKNQVPGANEASQLKSAGKEMRSGEGEKTEKKATSEAEKQGEKQAEKHTDSKSKSGLKRLTSIFHSS